MMLSGMVSCPTGICPRQVHRLFNESSALEIARSSGFGFILSPSFALRFLTFNIRLFYKETRERATFNISYLTFDVQRSTFDILFF
jgi:hypothetical protein